MNVNQQQSEAWNGAESVHYVDHADRYDRQLAPFAEALLERAGLQAHHRVLDVGCGCGVTTLASARVARRAVGVDISTPLLEVAAARASSEALGTAEFVVADAQTYAFEQHSFDVVLSLFGLMFFDDPVSAYANLRHSMAPEGRISFVSWQGIDANEWLMIVAGAVEQHAQVPALGGRAGGPGMFFLKDPDETTALLDAAGFTSIEIGHLTPNILIAGGGSLDESADFMLGMGIVRGLLGRIEDPTHRAAAIDVIRASLSERYEPGVGVRLGAAGWLVSAGR